MISVSELVPKNHLLRKVDKIKRRSVSERLFFFSLFSSLTYVKNQNHH